MNEHAKITASHLSRQAIVYLRQSSAAQVENNRELTDRQYALAAKARELGWAADPGQNPKSLSGEELGAERWVDAGSEALSAQGAA